LHKICVIIICIEMYGSFYAHIRLINTFMIPCRESAVAENGGKMKKLLSVILTVAMLLGTLVYTATAATDTCIRLSDTNGSSGYSAGAETVSDYVIAQNGATLIFDVYVESYSTPASGMYSQILAFSGDTNYNYAAYNFTTGAFTAGEGTAWPTQAQNTTFKPYASRDHSLKTKVWYELAYQFNGNEVTVYLDGIPMVSAELDKVENKYIILYPQYCTILIDNIRVCGKDYNVRDRIGDVLAVDSFTGITSVSGATLWDFDGSYSVSQNGKPMPELGDMLPKRTVAPAVNGSYLQYKSSGAGLAEVATDFAPYNGFTVVENIRVDRKTAGANFAVKFAGNYIAGYDWDSSSFRIAYRTGYGFNTAAAYLYANTSYVLEIGQTYEFAVRQNGNCVTIYLNGVVVAQAVNDAFTSNFNSVEFSHYRINGAVDNVVVAYSDYDVKEATGNTIAKFTFDESPSYINDIVDFHIGETTSGYTVVNGTDLPTVSVDSVEVVNGTATVGVYVSGCSNYNGFELSVAYPSELSIAKATPSSYTGGTLQASATTKNPYTIVCATNGATIPDSKIVEIKFNVPGGSADHEVTATLIPYIDGVPMAEVSGTGTLTVPKQGITEGLPSGLGYDGETLYWDYLDGATLYDIYVIHSIDGYEEYIDCIEETEYELVFTDYYSDPYEYTFKIFAYDENYEIFAVSDPLTVLYDENENLYLSISDYASAKYNELLDLIAEREYSSSNQYEVDGLLEEASIGFEYCSSYSEVDEIYDVYYTAIDEVPTGSDDVEVLPGDANNDGAILLSDVSYLARVLSGADIEIFPGADVDSNGAVNLSDLSTLRRNLS